MRYQAYENSAVLVFNIIRLDHIKLTLYSVAAETFLSVC